MAKSRGGVVALIIGIVCMLAGLGLCISSVFPLMIQFEPLVQMESPNPVELTIEEPGTYTLWHDYQTAFNGKSVSNPEALPADFTFALTPRDGGKPVGLDPLRTTTSTVSFGTREALGIGTFALSDPGGYTLEISNPAQDPRVFSLTQGDFLRGMAQFGLRLLLGVIVGLGGVVLLVLGIVFMVRRPKAPPPGPAGGSPASPPPPMPG